MHVKRETHKTQCVGEPKCSTWTQVRRVFFRDRPQRKIVDKNGFFSLVGRQSPVPGTRVLHPTRTSLKKPTKK